MLSSITPLGERARNRRWGTTAAFYVAGAMLGGALLGWLVGLAGSLVPAAVRPAGMLQGGLVVVVLALAIGFETRLLRWSLPTPHRQVNENWLGAYRGWVVGVGFGAQLGFGVVTMITSAATYAMILLMFLTHSPAMGAAIGLAFGLARSLPVISTRSVISADRLRALHSRVGLLAPAARRLTSSVLAAAALFTGLVVVV